MNFINRHIFRAFAAMLLCGIALSCSQDEIGLFQQGEYPLRLTASVEGMVSRAADTDSWDDGDIIRVRIGTYPWVGKYVLNADGSVKDAIDALAWPFENGIVSAWYPFLDEGSEVPIGDQSNGYHAFNFMKAITKDAEKNIVEKNYKDIVNLNFEHQMTKVGCELIKGDGVTEEDLKTATVSYFGFTTVKFSEDGISGANPEWITPASDFSALLVPQNMSGNQFIKVNLTVTVNDVPIDKELIYNPGEFNLEAGTAYNFKITVQKDRLVVDPITAAWNDEKGSEYADAVPRRVNLNIPGRKGPTLRFSENVTTGYNDTRAGNFPDYLIVKGREFTISYDVNDENAMMGIIPLIDDADKVKMNCLRIDEDYIFTFKLLSDDTVSLEYTEYAGVGDFYYSDGTWSRGLTEGKTPIGVVFRSGAAGTASANNLYGVDTPGNYDFDHPIRGYVVALNDASLSKGFWGGLAKNNYPPYFIIEYNKDKAENQPENTRYSGYLNTQDIITDKKKLGSDKIYGDTKVDVISKYIDHFWAFKVACEYRPSNLDPPSTSSGWYLPSIRQLIDIAECFQLKYCLLEAEGTAFDNASAEYWSSSEYVNTETQATLAHAYNIAKRLKNQSSKMSKENYVRSVLTF